MTAACVWICKRIFARWPDWPLGMCGSSRLGKRRYRWQAMSYAETIIVLGLMGIILVMVGELTLGASRSSRQSTKSTVIHRQAIVALDTVARELRYCQAILWPRAPGQGWNAGYSCQAASGQNLALVYRRCGLDKAQSTIVGYLYDGGKCQLERVAYVRGFVPTANNTRLANYIVSRRTLATNITGVSFFTNKTSNYNGVALAGLCLQIPGYNQVATAYRPTSLSRVKPTIRSTGSTPVPMPLVTEVRTLGV